METYFSSKEIFQVRILMGLLKKIIMEDIFEQLHYDFINSEDYFQYMKEFFEYEEKEALYLDSNEL